MYAYAIESVHLRKPEVEMTAVFTDAAMTRIEEAARTILAGDAPKATRCERILAILKRLTQARGDQYDRSPPRASRSACWRRNDTSSCSGLVGLPGSGKSTWARRQGVGGSFE